MVVKSSSPFSMVQLTFISLNTLPEIFPQGNGGPTVKVFAPQNQVTNSGVAPGPVIVIVGEYTPALA